MLRQTWRRLQWTFAVAASVLFVAALVVSAALRFWLLPNVDRYRADVAARLTASVGLPVTLGRLEGDWVGFWPRVSASDVGISDSTGRQALHLPRIEAQLSWWSLLALDARLHLLQIDGPALTIRRDAAGELYVAGLKVAGKEASGGSDFAAWVLHQPNVVVRDAVIQWIDETRGANPLVLGAVMVKLESHGSRHRVGLQAQPPVALGHGLDVRGDVTDDETLDPMRWRGSLFARVDDTDFEAMRPYVALPGAAQRGRGSLRAWFDFAGGRIVGVAGEVNLRDVALHLSPEVKELRLGQIAGRVSYKEDGARTAYSGTGVTFAMPGEKVAPKPQDFELKLTRAADGNVSRIDFAGAALDFGRVSRVTDAIPMPDEFRGQLAAIGPTGRFDDVNLSWRKDGGSDAIYRIKAHFSDLGWNEWKGLPGLKGVSGTLDCDETAGRAEIRSGRTELAMSKVFATPLAFDRVSARLGWKRHGGVSVEIADFAAAGPEVEVNGKASYRTLATGPGWIDLKANVLNLDARAAWRYVPVVVNTRTRDWLRTSLLAGRGHDGKVDLRGDLAHFPFDGDRGGLFRITAKVSGGEVSFSDTWPRLDRIEADLDFHGDAMIIDGRTARTLDSPLRRVRVTIDKLSADDNELDIVGESVGAVAEHLRYVMLSPVRERIHGATDGFVATGNGQLDLRIELPLSHVRDGKVAGRYRFDGGTLDGGKGSFPQLRSLKGELSFTENNIHADALHATVLGGPATVKIGAGTGGHTSIDAQGTATGADLAGMLGTKALQQMNGKVDWKGTIVIREGKGSVDLDAQGTLFGDRVTAHVVSMPAGGLQVDVGGRVDPKALATQFDSAPLGWVEGRPEVRGTVKLREQRTEVHLESDVVFLGEPAAVRIDNTPDGATRIVSRGRIAAEALARATKEPLLKRLAGRTPYTAEVIVRDGAVEARIESTLEGVASDLPNPLRKTAEESLPLVVEDRGSGTTRTLSLRLGQILSAKASRSTARGQPDRWQRIGLAFGPGQAALPDRDGVAVTGTVAQFDFGQWHDLLAPAPPAAQSGQEPAASAPGLQVSAVDLQVERMAAFGRDFHAVGVRARREGAGWGIVLSGPELSGKATWLSEGKGKLMARLDNFTVPAVTGPGTRSEPPQDKSGRSELPALDVVAERFVVRGHALGRLEVSALNEGRDWRLERLKLAQPDSTLEATGVWRGVPTQSRTSLKIQLNSSDAGKLLASMGYVDMVKRAPTQIKGDIAWDGSPFDFSPPTLDGSLRMDAKSGQFLKVDPGLGKLLGLISLQSLPRRVKLDFRDIFSDGFAFDSIGADVGVTRGILHTENFEMKGPAAKVTMKGDVDLRNETQSVVVRVQPSLGEGVALATGVALGPVVGAATLLAQKLLKNPLDKILSYEYSVGGSWSDPKVAKVSGSNSGANGKQNGGPLR